MLSFMRVFGKKRKKHHDVVESFQNSFETDNANELIVGLVDLSISKFIVSDAVNRVPVVGILNDIYKVYKDIHAYRLAKKVYLFLYYTSMIKVEEKREFVHDYIESNQEEGIDALLSVIDQMDNQNKVEILARLLKAKIDNLITIYEFNRLVACLQRVPYSDIIKLVDYISDHYEPGETDVLFSAGVVYLSNEDSENRTNKYMLNRNGFLILKYGLGKPVQIPSEYKVKRLSLQPIDVEETLKIGSDS